jgi:hypothetical protein
MIESNNPYLPADRQDIDNLDNDIRGGEPINTRYHYVITFNDLSNAKQMELKESLRENGLPDALIEKVTDRAWCELEVWL